jgi:DNA repair photolyase
MSLPTLDNRLSKVYEPKAPAPSLRLNTLQAAKEAGLHVYVATAPTYPECDEADLRKTLQAIRELDPITVFHEPINIRAQNVARIAKHAEELGIKLRTEVFASRVSWCRYALESLNQVQRLAEEVGLGDCLHAWPDKQLLSESYFLKIRKQARDGQSLTRYQEQLHRAQDIEIYEKTFRPWLEGWWSRISEWPGEKSNRRVATTATH